MKGNSLGVPAPSTPAAVFSTRRSDVTHRSFVPGAAALFGGLLLVLVAVPAFTQDAGPQLPLKLTSFAINMGASSSATSTGTIDITIERWSTDAERDRLLDALIGKGSDKLLSTLQSIKPRAGYVRSTRTLSWDIYYARMQPGEDGGYRLVFATDRPINYWEARNNTRSSDYEFMLCEIRMDKNGKGKGKLAVMAKVTYDKKKKAIEIENWDTEPVRLNEVKVVK
jgi:hypothetical protein